MPLQAPIIGGLFIGVLSALPLVGAGNCCCGLWVVSGGLLAAYLDQQNDPRPTTVGRGALAGFIAGIIGALVFLVLSIVFDALLSPLYQRAFEEMGRMSRDMNNPEMQAIVEQLQSRNTAGGYAVGFFLMLILGGLLSTLGGVLGAAFFKKDVPPALGGDAPPPMPLPPPPA